MRALCADLASEEDAMQGATMRVNELLYLGFRSLGSAFPVLLGGKLPMSYNQICAMALKHAHDMALGLGAFGLVARTRRSCG